MSPTRVKSQHQAGAHAFEGVLYVSKVYKGMKFPLATRKEGLAHKETPSNSYMLDYHFNTSHGCYLKSREFPHLRDQINNEVH